ncbi:MAG: RNA polymerase sigma factor [Gemmataceae bacterium]
MTSAKPSRDLEAWIVAAAPRALAYALTLVRQRAQAEDLVQDCFRRLLARGSDYDLLADGDKLLFKSVSNACLNWLERRKPQVALGEFAETLEGGAGPEELAMRNELGRAIDASLLELPATQRAAIQHSSLGHSLYEVAEMLDITYANARVQVHRARAALAERLRPFLTEMTE